MTRILRWVSRLRLRASTHETRRKARGLAVQPLLPGHVCCFEDEFTSFLCHDGCQFAG